MPEPMRQEIEVWDVLPAIRRELAKELIRKHKLSQRETAEKLGITEAAISQYMSSKRGLGITFGHSVSHEIRKSAEEMLKKGKSVVQEMHRLCNLLDVKKVVCKIHRSRSKNLPKNCRICLE
jgi:predicted transcriptional regulator